MELDPLSCVRDFDDAAENLPLCGGALPRRIRWEAATAAEAIRPFAPSARGHAQGGPRWRPPPCYLSLRSIHTIPGITEPGHDVAVLVEPVIDGRREDPNVGM